MRILSQNLIPGVYDFGVSRYRICAEVSYGITWPSSTRLT